MTTAERFLEQAAECERMSKISPDRTNKALWLRVAETLRQYGELERKNASSRTKQRNCRPRPAKAPLH
jgi:hypothetical protein